MSQLDQSQEWSKTSGEETTKIDRGRLNREILVHIANFGAHLDDLHALFGMPSGSSAEAAHEATRKAACISEKEISSKLRGWKKKGLVARDKNRPGEAAFYLCTEAGMRQAGFGGWSSGLSRPRDTNRLERGSPHGRLVASVAAAVRINLEREGIYEETTLLSVWGIRRQGRISMRYRFETSVRTRHLPAVVISPHRSLRQKATMIEAFDGSLDSAQIRMLCYRSNNREDVGSLRCYVTETDLSIVRQVVRNLDSTGKITVFAVPDGADAMAIAELEEESIPCASELTVDERRLQLAILRCVGEFGSVSEVGLMEFFAAEDEVAFKRILDASVEEKLLIDYRYLCDGVKLMWLTAAGAGLSKTRTLGAAKTIKQARLEKDSLRVAASLMTRFPSRMVTNSRTLARAGKQMALIGDGTLGVRPVFLVRKDEADKSPVAVLIINEIRTESHLTEVVGACVVDRSMSRIVIYAARPVVTVLKRIVSAQDDQKRISVRPLPVSERIQVRRTADEKRSAVRERRQAGTERRLARQAASAAKPKTRSERHVGGLPDEKPVSDAMWNEFSSAFYEKVDKRARHGVSWRLVVNVLIWLVEKEQTPSVLRDIGSVLSPETFRTRLDAVHKADMWEQLQRLVSEHVTSGIEGEEVTEPLDWQLINPVVRRHELSVGVKSGYEIRGADTRTPSEPMDSEALIAEMARLRLREESPIEDE